MACWFHLALEWHMHYILIIPIGGLWRDAIQVAVLVSQPQHVFRGLMKASLGGLISFPPPSPLLLKTCSSSSHLITNSCLNRVPHKWPCDINLILMPVPLSFALPHLASCCSSSLSPSSWFSAVCFS